MDELDDDKPVGRVLSRREMLCLLGGASAALIVGAGFSKFGGSQVASAATQAATMAGTATLPACVVRPEETEGPYFVDEMLNRSDIRIDPSDNSVTDGIPLHLVFRVSQVGTNSCTPLKGAQIDVWHCNAAGVYSDVKDPSFDTTGKKYLRGYQITGADGTVEFMTIYPGWYQGRTVHIHFKIRTDPTSQVGYEFTSQLFFDDKLTDQVYTQKPYVSKGIRTLRNDGDSIYQGGGDQLLLDVTKEGDGYAATFDIGVDTSQPKSAASAAGTPPGGAPRRGTPPQDGGTGN
ncbi:MAG: intradiol ring-cleavage dioxygenase [Chloroflexota bacterium]